MQTHGGSHLGDGLGHRPAVLQELADGAQWARVDDLHDSPGVLDDARHGRQDGHRRRGRQHRLPLAHGRRGPGGRSRVADEEGPPRGRGVHHADPGQLGPPQRRGAGEAAHGQTREVRGRHRGAPRALLPRPVLVGRDPQRPHRLLERGAADLERRHGALGQHGRRAPPWSLQRPLPQALVPRHPQHHLGLCALRRLAPALDGPLHQHEEGVALLPLLAQRLPVREGLAHHEVQDELQFAGHERRQDLHLPQRPQHVPHVHARQGRLQIPAVQEQELPVRLRHDRRGPGLAVQQAHLPKARRLLPFLDLVRMHQLRHGAGLGCHEHAELPVLDDEETRPRLALCRRTARDAHDAGSDGGATLVLELRTRG